MYWTSKMHGCILSERVSKIKSILSIIFHSIYGAVCIQLIHFLLRWLWEYMYFVLLSSSNRKYDPFAIVEVRSWKQWYALYVFIYSYSYKGNG